MPTGNILYLKNNQQQYKRQTGFGRIMEVTTKSGAMFDSNGNVYVRIPGGFDTGSTSVKNHPVAMRVQPGVNLIVSNGRKVWVGRGYDGREEIKGNVSSDLKQANINPRQLNGNDPSARFKTLSLISDLNSFPTGGDGTVMVYGAWVRRPNGKYMRFAGETSIDILSLQPSSALFQVVVGLFLDFDTRAIVTRTSSEIAASTLLELNANLDTLETAVNECAEKAPAGSQGVWAWRVYGDDTVISESNKLCDMRGIIGSGSSGISQLEPLTNGDPSSPEFIFSNGDIIMAGAS